MLMKQHQPRRQVIWTCLRLRKRAKELAAVAEKKAMQAQQIANQARKEVSTGIVGTAALYAAIKHRAENQDTNWYEYKTEDGRTGDLRPYFLSLRTSLLLIL